MLEPKDKWNDFLNWIDSHSSNSYYRGHCDKSYLLYPKIGRLKNYSLELEVNMFEHFKRRSSLYSNPKNDFEWLALAQHHGLPTRLLDWSLNPLVACFFAVKDNKAVDGKIYSINEDNDHFDLIDIGNHDSPFSINKIYFLHPPLSSRRIELQKGIFSIHPRPNKPVLINSDTNLAEVESIYGMFKNYYKKFNYKKPLIRPDYYLEDLTEYVNDYYSRQKLQYSFEIPSNCKDYFETKVRSLGIDETIFGDLDGIAKNIEYTGISNNIHKIVSPNKKQIKPFWEKELEKKIIDYFEEKGSIFGLDMNLLVCDENISVNIVDIDGNHFNVKTIYAGVSIVFKSRLCHEQKLFEDLQDDMIGLSNYIAFAKELNLPYPPDAVGAYHANYKFKIEIFSYGFVEKIEKVTSITFIDKDEQNGFNSFLNHALLNTQSYLQFVSNIKNQINETDAAIIENNFYNSLEFKSIVAKYKNFVFSGM